MVDPSHRTTHNLCCASECFCPTGHTALVVCGTVHAPMFKHWQSYQASWTCAHEVVAKSCCKDSEVLQIEVWERCCELLVDSFGQDDQ